MHLLRHPRNAAFLGLVFVVVGIIFWALPAYGGWETDPAGVTMLLALGASIAVMAYVLAAGTPHD